MNAEVEVLRPTFPGWPVEKIRAAIEVIRIMESAVEPTRSRRGAGLPDGAPLPPAGTVLSLPAGGAFSWISQPSSTTVSRPAGWRCTARPGPACGPRSWRRCYERGIGLDCRDGAGRILRRGDSRGRACLAQLRPRRALPRRHPSAAARQARPEAGAKAVSQEGPAMTRRQHAAIIAAWVGLGAAYAFGTWWLAVRTMPPYRGWPL